jgi:competence protein ComEC
MLLDRLHTIVPDRQSYAVAAALMFGYRNELDDTLMQSFRNIGAAHILAISGTHFAILFGMLYFLLSFIGNSRKGRLIKQLILLPFVWGFAFLTGFSPSVIRAALMLTIWGVGEAFASRSFSLNTVAVAAFFMLLFYPLYLFDVGFQLSFMAVIAILLINPYLTKLYESKNPLIQYGWGLCCVSVSAQVGVLPLSVYYFHQVPVFFLLTNLFLLPLAAALLFLIPVSLLLHTLFGQVAWLMFPVNRFLEGFISVTKALDRFSYHNIQDVHLSLWDTAVWFLAIVFLVLLLVKKRGIYLCLFILLLALQGLYNW